MATRWMDSPIGGLRLHANAGLLVAIDFDAKPMGNETDDPLLDRAEEQLREYFAAERREFDLPLAQDGTEWQLKVWDAVRHIPYGDTASYGDIAHRLGYAPDVSRAVGLANGANRLPIVVPCHRVVGADGSLTGYRGGVERKQWLLAMEQPGLF